MAAISSPLRSGSRPLRIGLLNNMPDAAFEQTERQFRRLLGADVALALFAFHATPRGVAARSRVEALYLPHEALGDAGLHALIVTGCEPRASRLEDEACYRPLGAVIDWAAQATASTLFSCLAAHVAVQHLHGIRRRPLPAKLTGVFSCAAAAAHPLLAGMPARVPVPHSRWNDLAEADLVDGGYTVLRRSAEAGVDLFVREQRGRQGSPHGSLFVFCQGHPEYDADSLAREYRRDIGRFLDGAGAICPSPPQHYFPAEAETLLARIAAGARVGHPPVGGAAAYDAPRAAVWQPAAARLLRNWLRCVAERAAAGTTAHPVA